MEPYRPRRRSRDRRIRRRPPVRMGGYAVEPPDWRLVVNVYNVGQTRR